MRKQDLIILTKSPNGNKILSKIVRTTKPIKKIKKSNDKEYLNAKAFYELVCECLEENTLKPRLLKAFELLVENIMRKNYYSSIEDKKDCKNGAMLALLKAWKKFDPTKTTNAFSFFTQCVKNGLIVTWNEIHPEKLKNNVSLNLVKEDFEDFSED